MLSAAYPRAHQALDAVFVGRSPRRHQAVACAMMLREFERGGGFALFHDMGTGKTLTAMGTFAILAERGQARTMLVACPKSVVGAWVADNEWVPSVKVVGLSGKDAKGKAAKLLQIKAELRGEFDPNKDPIARGPNDPVRPVIIVTNIESVWREAMVEPLKNFGFDVIAADESQRIKGAGSNQSMMMARLAQPVHGKPPLRVGMTGTPNSEGSIDLYGQYRFIDRAIFGGNFVNFKNEYFTTTMVGPQGKQFPIIEPRQDRQPELLRKMMSIAHVVKSEDVLDLPKTLPDRLVLFDLPPKARKIYDQLEAECFAEIADEFGTTGEIEADHILTKVMRLHEIGGGGIKLDGSDVATELHTEGVKALVDEVQLAAENGLRSVVFHRYTREGEAIVKALGKAKDPKLKVLHMTASMNEDERGAVIRQYQRGEADVFVTQIRLGGLGVTLTAGCRNMFYSTGSSGEEHHQARHRTDRMGQTQRVQNVYFAARDTVSVKIVQAIRDKRDVAEELLGGGWRDYLRGKHD